MARVLRWLGLLLLTAGLVVLPAGSQAVPLPGSTSPTDRWGPSDLVLFWGDGCPHCEAEMAWLEEATDTYPDLIVHLFEVWYDEANRVLLEEVAAQMGFEVSGVPVTVMAGRHWIGWSEVVQGELTAHIEAQLDSGADVDTDGDTDGDTDQSVGGAGGEAVGGTTIEVPFFGEVTLGESLVASTIVIGFVDGMNPCSLWVITVLLAIVVRTGARGRVIAVGVTYLLVTAVMYGLFILGIYSALGLVSYLGLAQVVVALVAGTLGVLSIKDYFAFKQGVSMTIRDSAKPGLYQRMRGAAGHAALLPALGATVVLAVGVSFIEIPCTAGFPLLWAGMLEANDVGFIEGLGLLGLFMIPYLLDELIVFGLAVFTMRSLKMQERHGRVLKLIAGTMMIALALTMLIAPEAMNRPLVAVAIFAAAMGAAALVHLITRRVRPGSFHEPRAGKSHSDSLPSRR
ncbi:MAG: hypothetical protein H5T81_11285 [Tetrasphaera sp.]|nr:hypothetical protein [Tetrasphaera sp.]